MNTQDVLESLTSLERELSDIRSAKEMVKDTVNSYKEVRLDLDKVTAGLQSGLQSISGVLIKLTTIFEGERESISSETKKVLQNLEKSCKSIQTSFEKKCHETIDPFTEHISQTTSELSKVSTTLTKDHVANNKTLKSHIAELEKIQTDLGNTIEFTNSLNPTLDSLKEELTSVLSNVSLVYDETRNLSDKISSMLDSLKEELTSVLSNVSLVYDETKKLSDKISSLSTTCEALSATCKKSKIVGWINLTILLLALILLFLSSTNIQFA